TVGSAELGPDNQWRLGSERYGELFTNRGRPHNNFVYQSGSFIATSGLLRDENPFKPNDHAWLLHENNSGHALFLDNTTSVEDITLQDLSFVNIPGMVVAGELTRGLHLNRVELAVDPSTNPLLASASDGVHINANGGDIVI